jgi:hypothetical protein
MKSGGAADPILQYALTARDAFSRLRSDSDWSSLA